MPLGCTPCLTHNSAGRYMHRRTDTIYQHTLVAPEEDSCTPPSSQHMSCCFPLPRSVVSTTAENLSAAGHMSGPGRGSLQQSAKKQNIRISDDQRWPFAPGCCVELHILLAKVSQCCYHLENGNDSEHCAVCTETTDNRHATLLI